MAAPVAQLDVEHQFLNEFWTNRYLVDLPPADSASTPLINAVVAAHRAIMFNNSVVTRVRHATLAPGDDDYTIAVINLPGNRPGDTTVMLPLFCTVRVDFGTTAGRPSRKYLRAVLTESDMTGMNVAGAWLTTFGTPYVNAILAQDNIVDPQGDTFLTGSVATPIQMRQLRRGSRRRTEPVL